MTISELRRELIGKIDPVDARIIVRLATGLDEIHQITESARVITDDMHEKALSILGKRLSGTPMAYITGEKEFYGHVFKVTPSVLIPRPDTETLVECAIESSRDFRKPRILDLCTGSGAVAASVAYELKLPVALSDISPAALEIAKDNYRRIVGEMPDARLGDLFEPWRGSAFDIIVSNPPYLTDSWYEETEQDVKAEPVNAFIGGGPDGLDLIRNIVGKAKEFLSPNGILALECDYRQIGICGSLFENNGFSDVHSIRDLANKERVIYGRRLPE